MWTLAIALLVLFFYKGRLEGAMRLRFVLAGTSFARVGRLCIYVRVFRPRRIYFRLEFQGA